MIRTANANFVIFNLGNKKIENAILSRNITGCADHTLSSDTKVNVPNTSNHENKDIPNVMVDLNGTDHGKNALSLDKNRVNSHIASNANITTSPEDNDPGEDKYEYKDSGHEEDMVLHTVYRLSKPATPNHENEILANVTLQRKDTGQKDMLVFDKNRSVEHGMPNHEKEKIENVTTGRIDAGPGEDDI